MGEHAATRIRHNYISAGGGIVLHILNDSRVYHIVDRCLSYTCLRASKNELPLKYDKTFPYPETASPEPHWKRGCVMEAYERRGAQVVAGHSAGGKQLCFSVPPSLASGVLLNEVILDGGVCGGAVALG